MKKLRYLSGYLLCLLTLSSYTNPFEYGLDIFETGHIHNNGSGNFEIAADLTKAEPLIKMVGLLTNIVPDIATISVQEVFLEVANSLKKISGISHVAATHDEKQLHFKLSFQFRSIKALNRAIRQLYTHAEHPGCTYFKMDHRSFKRVDTQNFAQLSAYYHAKIDPKIANMIPPKKLNVVTYHLAYRFDKKIKTTTHTLASISEDRFTLFLEQPLFDACEKEVSLSNEIIF
jgi:hypothetical protein